MSLRRPSFQTRTISLSDLQQSSLISSSQVLIIESPKMPPTTLAGSADSKNKFEDLSGVDIAAYANPYDALIEACGNPVSTLYFPTALLNRALYSSSSQLP
jgi:hypothetical protein